MTGFRNVNIVRGSLSLWTEWLPADGPACLLVGGAGAISAFWPDHLCAGLAAAGTTVVRYDHRDTGNSSFVDFETSPYSRSAGVARR